MVGKALTSRESMKEISYWVLPLVYVLVPGWFMFNEGFGVGWMIVCVSGWIVPILLGNWFMMFGFFQSSTSKILYSWLFAVVGIEYLLAGFCACLSVMLGCEDVAFARIGRVSGMLSLPLALLLLYVCFKKRKCV